MGRVEEEEVRERESRGQVKTREREMENKGGKKKGGSEVKERRGRMGGVVVMYQKR